MTSSDETKILMAHGGGGERTQRLLKERILPKLQNAMLNPLLDSAVLPRPDGRICMTTDGFVVQPIEFPGADIGHLSVCGTVNDLAVMGAKPLGLSLSLIIEEGLDINVFERIIESIGRTAEEAGVPIITGDTKVVELRNGDGMTITTAGIGVIPDGLNLSPSNIRPGDTLIINGPLAEHGLAVMSAREGLSFGTVIESDAAPLNGMIADILATGADVKFMRDMTRSGLAGVLVDICETTVCSVEVFEKDLPITTACRHAAEFLGLDPLTIANEGNIMIAVAPGDADKVLAACKAHKYGKGAAIIGTVNNAIPPLAELVTPLGGRRIIQRPYGEELPRIC
jgi:hydrogenase expression/formation protein HypE